MNGARSWVAVLILLLGVSAAPVRAAGADMLSGRVTLPEHVATPPAAVLEVALVDLSALDEDDHLLGSLRLDNPGGSPIHFSVPYDRSRIVAAHRYVVRAVVRVNGTPLYAGEVALASRGRFSLSAQIVLKPADGQPSAVTAHAGPVLSGTEWRVIEIDGHVVTDVDGGHEPSLAFGDPDRLTGNAGCNRLVGRYEAADGALHTDSIVTTRMACAPPAMTTESRVLAALAATASVLATGDVLELRDGAGMVRLRLMARHTH